MRSNTLSLLGKNVTLFLKVILVLFIGCNRDNENPLTPEPEPEAPRQKLLFTCDREGGGLYDLYQIYSNGVFLTKPATRLGSNMRPDWSQ